MKLDDIFTNSIFLEMQSLNNKQDKISKYDDSGIKNSMCDRLDLLLEQLGMNYDTFRWCSVQYKLFKIYNKCCFSLDREINFH